MYHLEASLGFLVYRVHQHAAAAFRHALEPVGLTPPQFGVLARLCVENGQRQATLCERCAVDPNTMVGIVDRLEKAGLVVRRRDPQDRRACLVQITAKGRRAFAGCAPARAAASAEAWAALTRAEQGRLRNLLRKALRLPPLPAQGKDPADGC
ncbi:MAG: MarR family transcriptional regulator [Phycisphaerae bacterium]|jgi:DNA-binding MarR family transcriptional regulator